MRDGGGTLSRRQILVAGSGLAAAAGAAAAAMVVAGRGSAPSRPAESPAVLPSPTPAQTAAATPLPQGGIARLVAARSLSFDTFDAQRSGEPSVIEVMGRTHSGLVDWVDFGEPRLGAGLAARWEQPDAQSLVLHLDPVARWQDRAPLGGRAVTAADVAAHLERTLALVAQGRLPGLQDAAAYGAIDRVTATAATTLRIDTSHPDPCLLETLAGRFALVQAPEAVAAFEKQWQELRPETVVGSGPFVYEGLANGTLRFTAFRGGHRQPALDGLTVAQPGRDDAARFVAGELDEVITRDRRDAPRVRQALPHAAELARFQESPVVTTFFAGAAPWNNPELVRALSGALNRQELARRLFGGRAAASALVTPVTPGFALSDAELAAFPGYRSSLEDDVGEARKRWTAAGGPALGPVTVEFPSIFDPLYGASDTVIGMLGEALGPQFKAAVDTYTAISAKALDRAYGNGKAALWFGWAPPLEGPDPSRALLDVLGASGATAAALGIAGQAPRALSRLVVEFDLEARRSLAREAARAHLELGSPGIVSWLLQRDEVFRTPNLGRSAPVPFWPEHLDQSAYFSQP